MILIALVKIILRQVSHLNFQCLLYFLVTSLTIIGLCLGGAVFVLCMAAVTCYCYRQRRQHHAKRHGPDQPLAFQTHRRPTAVKSPAGATTHYLKKSPSPTGPSKTPPGASIIYCLDSRFLNAILFLNKFFFFRFHQFHTLQVLQEAQQVWVDH